jgi:hypothetical protein
MTPFLPPGPYRFLRSRAAILLASGSFPVAATLGTPTSQPAEGETFTAQDEAFLDDVQGAHVSFLLGSRRPAKRTHSGSLAASVPLRV